MHAAVAEAALLAGARAGEDWATRELYARHAGRVLAVVRSRLGGDALAEDAAQDAWAHAFRALPRFRGEAAFSTWLHRIAVNAAVTARRGRARWARRHEPLREWDGTPAPSVHPLLRLQLQHALRELPDGMRGVLLLYLEGYTHREIAGLLGISEGTSKSQLSRARRHLRCGMNGDPGRPARLEA
jgi:RNA polymerase sigma-70 factor (ECF subfamily)